MVSFGVVLRSFHIVQAPFAGRFKKRNKLEASFFSSRRTPSTVEMPAIITEGAYRGAPALLRAASFLYTSRAHKTQLGPAWPSLASLAFWSASLPACEPVRAERERGCFAMHKAAKRSASRPSVGVLG